MKHSTYTKYIILFIFFLSKYASLQAQMYNGKDTLYGNEWIDYNQIYYKIKVSENAMYRLSGTLLLQNGIDLKSINGNRFQIYKNGLEIPIYVSSNQNPLNTNDYIEFFGEKNGTEFDEYLYANPKVEMLNTKYSLFTDTSCYYLTWNNSKTGKRFTPFANNLNNLPTKDTYYYEYETQVFSNNHSKKYIYQSTDKIYDSRFDTGEGFFSGFETSRDIKFLPTNINSSISESNCIIRYVSRIDQNNVSFSMNGTNILQETKSWYNVTEDTILLSTNLLNSGANLKITGDVGIAFATLQYPRNFDFSGKSYVEINLAASATEKYLEITNFVAGSKNPTIYDITNQLRLDGILDNNILKIKLPPSLLERKIVINAENGLKTINTIEKINFNDFTSNPNTNYFIITNKKLFNDGTGQNWVQQYADYRSSIDGGNYKVSIVEIEEIYNQFGFGISRSPQSFRNFGHHLNKFLKNKPIIFIIGEGREYSTSRTTIDLQDPVNESFHVPTWGAPGSDNLLLGKSKTENYPIFPIGRLAVTNAEDIKTYLAKVKDSESQTNNNQTITDRAWMKNMIHLGGGGPAEQAIIKTYINDLKNIVEKSTYGPNVNSYFKTSTDPIQISQSDLILKRINDGVSVITFFGHAAIGTFDFSIDNLGSYKNKNKYPFIMSLGCYSGNIHNNIRGIGKRFVFEKDAGGLSFGATSGQGYIYPLYLLAKNFYIALGDSLYGKTLGEQLQFALKKTDNNLSFDVYTLTQQFNLLGDPATKLYPAVGPDYLVDNTSIKFEPNVITTQQDSFRVSFSVQNIGSRAKDSMDVELIREFPDGSKAIAHSVRILSPGYADIYTVSLPIGGKKSNGLNKIYIKVDSKNEIVELPSTMAESNNDLIGINGLGASFYIIDNNAIPLYPSEFAIVNKPKVTLKASTGNPLAVSQKYLMEIDTTELFNSPLRRRQEIIQPGGILQWEPNIPFYDEKVYYWRVTVDSTIPSIGYTWSNSSFVYLPNSSEGWNQSHYYQFSKNDFENMVLRNDRRMEFGTELFNVRIQNKFSDIGNPPMWFYNDGKTSITPWNQFPQNIKEGIAVVMMDSIDSNTSFNSPSGDFGSIGNGQSTRYFVFAADKNGRKNLINYIKNILPTRTNINIFTMLVDSSADLHIDEWINDSISNNGENIFNVLEFYGSTMIRELLNKGTVPYCFAFRKDVGKINEMIGNSKFDVINMSQDYHRRLKHGIISSKKIGPVKSWSEIKIEKSELFDPLDTFYTSVYGFDTTGIKKLLLSNITSQSSLDFDPQLYQYISLEGYFSDYSIMRTSPQLIHWRVNYEPLPDAAVAPNLNYSFYKDTIQQGDQLALKYAIVNINEKPMDSISIQYKIKDDKNKENIVIQKSSPLDVGKKIDASFNYDTKNLLGNHQLTVELNPDKSQPESNYLNNLLVKPFFVKGDKINPLLDVTFDGQHILNGDIITPTPLIVGSLRDENPFLKLNDTVSFKVLLKSPTDNDVVQIPFDGSILKFFPSSGSSNKAYFEYKPTLLKDGIYQLIVQAKDVSGNISGALDYKINFEIVSKQAISNFLNYPNPFTTSTRFAYTLTGSESPSAIRIQIMTISGQIVKEITEKELGPLKIGRHLTDYAWDGTDQYGDKLANGVYLYRVTLQKSNGSAFEPINNEADKFFENGFGKMVILR